MQLGAFLSSMLDGVAGTLPLAAQAQEVEMSPESAAERRWSRWTTSSSLLAITALFAGALGIAGSLTFLLASCIFSAAWLVHFIAGLFIFGWRGLRMLVGLPLSMFWPILFALMWGELITFQLGY